LKPDKVCAMSGSSLAQRHHGSFGQELRKLGRAVEN
jgi:hypothetical protein